MFVLRRCYDNVCILLLRDMHNIILRRTPYTIGIRFCDCLTGSSSIVLLHSHQRRRTRDFYLKSPPHRENISRMNGTESLGITWWFTKERR